VHRLELKIPPAAVAAIVLVLAWLAADQLTFGDIEGAWIRPAAYTLAALGIGVGVAGVLQFRSSRTTIDPMNPGKASALVTSGLYRRTRNPMYLGMLLLLLSWALVQGSLVSVVVTLLTFVPYMNRFQIQPEERALKQHFGDEYVDYMLSVRRWI